MIEYLPLLISILALLFSFSLIFKIFKAPSGKAKTAKIAKAIHEGALTFLNKEYKIMGLFVLIVAAGLGFTKSIGYETALAFLGGAFLSGLAGNIGMRIATVGNERTAWAARKSLKKSLKIALMSGTVMGLSVVGLGVLGITLLYLIFKNPQIIYGFGFGASSIALFARVGGGIYTKSADVGADLVGEIEKGIPEDDPRNPAVIADNVGDNVGDVAGMGADLFESYVDSIIAAMVLGGGMVSLFGKISVLLPLILATAGIGASILGYLLINFFKKSSPQKVLDLGIFAAALLMAIFSYIIIYFLFPQNLNLFWTVLIGLVSGLLLGFSTEYYTSNRHKPTQRIAKSAKTGAATNIIEGLALGMRSTVIPLLIVAIAIFLAHWLGGLYGISLAAVGMLATLGITLATDSYGPVADNAAGIAEMANLGKEARQRTEALDAVGNTTAAIGKGFAIGSAALTALVLMISYANQVNLNVLDLLNTKVMIGLLLGGLLPFLFCSFTLRAVGKTAFKIVEEVRRQFKEIKGLIEGRASADYARCISLATTAALKEMLLPALLAVISPVIVGLLLGPAALGGLLAGSIVTGFLLAVMMANAGAAWDNAKKYIEEGNFGGKGSLAHKAAVIGDTVGDPFKDTAGPSLNILIKLMSIVALIITPLLL